MMPVNHRKHFERSPDAELYLTVVVPNQVGFDEVKILVTSPEDAQAKSQQIFADVDAFVAKYYSVSKAAYQLYKRLIKDPTCQAVSENGERCEHPISWHHLPTTLDGFSEDANCFCDKHQPRSPSASVIT